MGESLIPTDMIESVRRIARIDGMILKCSDEELRKIDALVLRIFTAGPAFNEDEMDLLMLQYPKIAQALSTALESYITATKSPNPGAL